jgi:hypothetical protein
VAVAVREELTGRLLENLLDWDADERRESTEQIRTLAELKYDGYEGFRAGQRFVESLAQWLRQMPELPMRRRWLDFALHQLIYIDRRELEHGIKTVYPDIIRPLLLRRAADELDVNAYCSAQIVESDVFRRLQRKLLILGLSDGARLDRLRRASIGLSHEQFALTVDIGDITQAGMLEKLRAALVDETALFNHVLLVDDFYGSGTSLVNTADDGTPKGKLARARDVIHHLADASSEAEPILETQATATIVLYIASARAQQHIREQLDLAGLKWDLHVVQTLGPEHVVSDPALLEDCEWFYDHILDDPFKGQAPHGYKQTALPVVLSHNSPNNSVCPLWADTTHQPKSQQRRALFPRYERHHPDRP